MPTDKHSDLPNQSSYKTPIYIMAARGFAWLLAVAGTGSASFLIYEDLKVGAWQHLWAGAAVATLSLVGGMLCLLAVEAVNQLTRAATYAERSFLLMKLELTRIEDAVGKNTAATDHIVTELVEIKTGPLQQLFWLGHTGAQNGGDNDPS